jgi:FtsP/CotA-like multicopper oxidase with cupredoxin domain
VVVILVLACTAHSPLDSTGQPTPGHTGPKDSGTSGSTDSDAPVHPALAPPAQLEDLDPDPAVLHVTLDAAPFTYAIGDTTIDGLAYNSQVPGPTLHGNLGDTLIVDFTNSLDEYTTVHWHGLPVPWEMDGITWMQDPIEPGGTFTYTFTLDRAGTYWYHPHFNGGDDQADRGLYGAIVVDDPDDPAPDVDVVLVLDAGIEHVEGTDVHMFAPDGPWTVDGLVDPAFSVASGSVVRARLLNASNTGYLDLSWPDARVIGTDQGLGAALATPASLVLAPGDRADVEWRVGPEGFSLTNAPYSLAGGSAYGEPSEILSIQPTGKAAAPPGLAWGFSESAPTADGAGTDIVWVFSGDGDVWMMNGETYPNVPVEEIDYGVPTTIEVRNLSASEHPFHLHGNNFEVLSVDGVAPPFQDIEDTVNVPIRSTVRLRVVSDNPGDWMAHCHILPHAEGGMMAVLRVNEPK